MNLGDAIHNAGERAARGFEQANCLCAVPDSFNVRPSDLQNPRCPIHGAGHLPDLENATREELERVVLEGVKEVDMGGHTIFILDYPFGPTDIARTLLARYNIRRKR